MSLTLNSQWYEEWFNSEYYHLLYDERNHKEAKFFIDNLITYLKPPKNTQILDLACGKGRHSIYLSNEYSVTGIDLSANSIQHACQFKSEKLSFFVHDMRKQFRVNHFDLVLNLFTSFGYFELEKDNQDIVKCIAKSLKPDGIMIIDFMNSKKVIKNLVEEEFKTINKTEFHIQRWVKNKFIIKQIEVKENGKSCFYQESVKVLTLKNFEKYFKSAGLEIIDLFGDYQLNIFDEDQSGRLILVAKKYL